MLGTGRYGALVGTISGRGEESKKRRDAEEEEAVTKCKHAFLLLNNLVD